MPDIREKINAANIFLEKGDFCLADRCFESAWFDLEEGSANDKIQYVVDEYDKYNDAKRVKLWGVLSDLEVYAGMGRTDLVYEGVNQCADVGRRMRLESTIGEEESRRMVSEMKYLQNLANIVTVSVCLSEAELFHRVKRFNHRDLSLELVRIASEDIGFDCEGVIGDVMSGKILY